MGTTESELRTPVKTAQRTFKIIETIKKLDGATLAELSDQIDLPKSSIHNYLRTLEHDGYIVKERKKYMVGLRFLDLGGFARTQKGVYEIAKTEVDTIADKTGEQANLLVEQDGRGIILYRAQGSDAVRLDSYIGQCVNLHTTALGKTILAHLPESQQDEIIEHHGLQAKTEHTITDPEQLHNELTTIAESGVAYDREERVKGLYCVAVPIFKGDQIEAAISISGPTSRMNKERINAETLPDLRSAANIIELNWTFSR
ncbi:IclR family transcriptional regulator [Natrialbaceae archaeon A-CW1-1]